jgi:hypothetical protein
MGKIVLTYDQPSGTNSVRKSRAHCVYIVYIYVCVYVCVLCLLNHSLYQISKHYVMAHIRMKTNFDTY